jgi:arylsulfatase A-like enzyme
MNLVLISLDTLRLDRMSLYGGPRQTTPTIDALAAKGVHFTNAFSPSPWTLPAHAAMLTGRYPSSLSVDFNDHLYKLAPLLSTILKNHGYRTAAVTGGGFVSRAYGANVGFDTFRIGSVEDAVASIQAPADKPFFLFFHTFVTHIPYRDRRYVQGQDGGRLADIYIDKGTEWLGSHLLLTCGWLSPTPAEKEFLLGLYDGGVAAADEMVAEILAALERAHVLDRTVVVITSDHGEEFWDHTDRGAYHGHTLYNELLRVPLIWYEPNLSRQGRVQSELVSLVDLAPTMLARLGFPVPAGLDGSDLSPLLDGGDWSADRKLFGEGVRHGPPRQSVLSATGKLIVNQDPAVQQGEGERCAVSVLAPRELYLHDDLAEEENRASTDAELADNLAGDLRAHTASMASTSTSASSARTPLDAATKERLKSLGYLK